MAASETACDDTHKYNPSDYDMRNAMRINLKPGKEPPAPEFRKQGHHMLEIIAAQIKEMEDQACSMQDESGSDLVSPSKRESLILNRIKLWP